MDLAYQVTGPRFLTWNLGHKREKQACVFPGRRSFPAPRFAILTFIKYSASSDLKLHPQRLVWELLLGAWNFSRRVNAMRLSYLHFCFLCLHHVQEELFNLYLHPGPARAIALWQVIAVYCVNVIVNVYLAQWVVVVLNIGMGIQDISGTIFKGSC